MEESTSQEEIKNSLTGEALLPSSQLQEPKEQRENPQATEDTQDSLTETPVIKAKTHIAEEKRAGSLVPPEQKALTQEEKLRRYYELRRKCEEQHKEEERRRKAEEAEKEACPPTPAESEAAADKAEASQSESTLPDYLIKRYEQMRKMSEEMVRPMEAPKDAKVEMQKVLDEMTKRPVIKAECTEAPITESKCTDKTPVAKTGPMEASDPTVASTERLAQAVETDNIPACEDRHIARTDNAPKPEETSKPPVAREESQAPKETAKPTDKGKYSGGGSSKDVYSIDYAPDIMRPTAEYFLLKTGRKGLRWKEVSVLRKLSATQYPTRVNKEIERACERFKKRNQSLLCLTLMYIWAALKNQPTWGSKAKQKARQKAEAQPEVVSKPMTVEEREAITAEINRLQAKFDEEARMRGLRE